MAMAITEESSRIFVRGLPPSMNEDGFKQHFGKYPITDTRLFANRRIGYVGYKTSEDAAKAVKYFNRTFIRMSKIAVELARPIGEAPTRKQYQQQHHPHGQTFTPTAANAAPVSTEAANALKRKRGSPEPVTKDPKLQEFLQAMQRPSQLRGHAGADPEVMAAANATIEDAKVEVPEGESDSEYENVPKKPKTVNAEKSVAQPQVSEDPRPDVMDVDQLVAAGAEQAEQNKPDGHGETDTTAQPPNPVSDDDWLRSRTSRLLGMVEDDDEDGQPAPAPTTSVQPPRQNEPDAEFEGFEDEPVAQGQSVSIPIEEQDLEDATPVNEVEEKVRQSQRLYLRNLSYNITEDDLREAFDGFGNLDEVHVSMDPKTGTPKGFAYLQFTDAESALSALRVMDGKVFQGRLLHILPAQAKRETGLDEFSLSKLPLKKQQEIKRKRAAATSTFNWNALYMNADAVMSSVADRLGVAKSELLDPTSSDAGVKQAHAETHIIQETKKFFKEHGVDLEAFKKHSRGDTTILVKNFPYDAKASELKELFEEHGKVRRFLMPPAGTIAIVEFEQAPQARAAFASLAYRKIRSSVLFLEKAPNNIFSSTAPDTIDSTGATAQGGIDAKVSTGELLEKDATTQDLSPGSTATLFVRNLNFSTTSDRLTEIFKPLGGFLTARVKTKTDAKKPGQVLSMGFGFLEFRSQQQAQAAQQAMDGYSLDGHKLQIRASHRATDAAEERRNQDKAKKLAARGTKIIVKNLPFEATKKDIRALFGAYGQLRSVRVPKKFDKGARGFAFADFTTPKEAENAMDALRDTHLLGRRLVLDFAAEESEDAEAEIEKMQQKAGSQLNKVALQKLTGAGRKKFRVGDDEEPVA